MRDLLMRNVAIKHGFDENEEVIEITRLVKKNVPENVLANRKNGISFRIGCASELFQYIIDPGFWAPHWEIRQWDNGFSHARTASRYQHGRAKNDRPSNVDPPPGALISEESQTQTLTQLN